MNTIIDWQQYEENILRKEILDKLPLSEIGFGVHSGGPNW